jgi:hypothetical protein
MKIEHGGVTIELEFDDAGSPLIEIGTDNIEQCSVKISLNGITLHDRTHILVPSEKAGKPMASPTTQKFYGRLGWRIRKENELVWPGDYYDAKNNLRDYGLCNYKGEGIIPVRSDMRPFVSADDRYYVLTKLAQ